MALKEREEIQDIMEEKFEMKLMLQIAGKHLKLMQTWTNFLVPFHKKWNFIFFQIT